VHKTKLKLDNRDFDFDFEVVEVLDHLPINETLKHIFNLPLMPQKFQ